MRHVFIATDDNALPQVLTVIYSLIVNVSRRDYAVTLVVDGDAQAAENKVKAEFADSGFTFFVHKAHETLRQCKPVYSRLPLPTFVRLEMTTYLPADAHRVLYLDTDVVVVDDVDELFTVPMDNTCMLVVAARHMVYDKMFNAGVLVINLDRWRELNVTERACYAALSNEKSSDEDILNYLLRDDVRYISCMFNYLQWGFGMVSLKNFLLNHGMGRRDVHIVHFQGDEKPWKYPDVPLARIYEMYANRNVNRELQNALLWVYTRWGRNERADVVCEG